MVYIVGENGIRRKYACHTCIKGHRSTRCDHKNRALVEIKRKGRPLSQCDECRALRKTRRVHIKCKCPPPSSAYGELTAVSTDDPRQPDSPRSDGWAFQVGGDPYADQKPHSHCNQPECPCLPPTTPDADTITSPAGGYETPLTPDDIVAQHKIPPPLSSMVLPPIRLPPPPPPSRIRNIPIHDPTDDIDSDTPIYKSEENNTLDRVAVLGKLSHTTSEDLMKQIYSPFLSQSSHERCTLTNDGEVSLGPDEKQEGIGKSDGL